MSAKIRKFLHILNGIIALVFGLRNVILIAHAVRIVLFLGTIPSAIEFFRAGRALVHILLLIF